MSLILRVLFVNIVRLVFVGGSGRGLPARPTYWLAAVGGASGAARPTYCVLTSDL